MEFICECGKTFSSKFALSGHKGFCKKYLGTERYEQRKKIKTLSDLKTKQTLTDRSKIKKQQELEKWISEQHTCEKCGKVMTEKFGSGRFCSRSCANTRQHSEEIKQKISNSVTKTHNENIITYFCIQCGSQVKQKDSLCGLCKHNSRITGEYLTDYVICPYCGKKLKLLHNTHLSKHNKTTKDLQKEFGNNYPTCSVRWASKNHENYTRGKFIPVELNGSIVTLKSTWEKWLFDLLMQYGEYFEYETKSIIYYADGQHIYKPDFYIPSKNLILEVKPDWARNNLAEVKRFYCELEGYVFCYVAIGDDIIQLLDML